jgi:hypothetical protein
MSDRAGDLGRCRACRAKVELISDWRSRLIALDVRPSTLRRPTFVEVEMGEFVEVHRHICEPKEPGQPYDGRDVRPTVEARDGSPALPITKAGGQGEGEGSCVDDPAPRIDAAPAFTVFAKPQLELFE